MNKLSFLIVFLLLFFSSYAQDQRVADSLKIIYKEDKLQGTEKLKLLQGLAYNEMNDLKLSMVYVEELIARSKEANNQRYLYSGYLHKGNNHMSLGDYEMALESYLLTAKIALEREDKEDEGISNMVIADVYAEMDNFDSAEKYYNKAIDLLRESKDSKKALGSALINAGDTYFNNKIYH
jgi:adenylate cyclase